MRTKDKSTLVANDLFEFVGVPRGSRRAQQLLDGIKPNRTGIPGEAIEIERGEIPRAALFVQMVNDGISDDLASRVSLTMLTRWILPDRRMGLDAGMVMVLRDQYGPYEARYISRADLNADSWEAVRKEFNTPVRYADYCSTVREAFQQMRDCMQEPSRIGHLENVTPVSFLLYDLQALLESVMTAVDKFCERESRPSMSVDELLDACTIASQVRDQVDSAESKEAKEAKGKSPAK